jgi:hypothetical protein
MLSASAFRTAVLVAAILPLVACDDLLRGQRQAQAAADSASAASVKRPSSRKSRPSLEGTEAAAAFGRMSQSLRRLVAAEQAFFAENGTYTEDFGRLGVTPLGETMVEFLWAAKGGWAARATHPGLPGRDCVTYIGAASTTPATMRYRRSGREGMILCDDERGPARSPIATSPSAATPGAAPTASPESTPTPVDTSNALDAVNPSVQMRVDLRKLGEAQLAYFGTQGRYSSGVERLPIQFIWQRGVSVTLLHADRRSWSARATHASRPGKSCVVWFGAPARRPATEAQRKVPERSGVPACDD